MSDLLFTPEQLREECRPLCDRAVEALQAGRIDRLRFLLGRMSVAPFELYYGYLHWNARIAGKILVDFGEAYLDRTLSQVTGFLVSPFVEELSGTDREKHAIAGIISMWTHQMGTITLLEETGDEMAFALTPCGSGGRLHLESWNRLVPQDYPALGGGRPVFCRICEHFRHRVNDAVGYPFWKVVPSPDRAGFCRMSFAKRSGQEKSLFSPHELDRLTTSRCRQALHKLDLHDLDLVDLIDDHHREWRPLHDLFCLLVTGMFSVVYRDKGLEYLSELVRETYVSLFQFAYITHTLLDDRTLLKMLVRNWYYHQARFQVFEEEERFVFRLDPCGSGGRLTRGEMGGKGRFLYGKGLLCTLSEASDITFMHPSFPSYCIHCAATNRDQLLGKPWAFLVDGESICGPSTPCRQYLYKKTSRRHPPPHLLSQVGLKEAEPLQRGYVL